MKTNNIFKMCKGSIFNDINLRSTVNENQCTLRCDNNKTNSHFYR